VVVALFDASGVLGAEYETGTTTKSFDIYWLPKDGCPGALGVPAARKMLKFTADLFNEVL